MPQIFSPLNLQQLLDCCSDRSSPWHELGWNEFIKRYKMFIYKRVIQRCSAWNIPRLGRSLADTVDDIVGMVFFELCKNEFQALQNFRARDDERMFRAWLATICKRMCNRYVRRPLLRAMVDDDIENLEDFYEKLESEMRWELHEFLVTELRAIGKTERDITIFQLYVLAGFSSPMIKTHPCLRALGDRVVDNVVNRIREDLRRRKDFFN